MRKVSLYLFIVALLAALTVTAVAAEGTALEYTVNFDALNESGVEGQAQLRLEGDQLTVAIQASGLEAGALHPQHIHGFEADKRNSTCPTAAADANGDGLVDLFEGFPNYGGVRLSLTDFPTAPGGSINYEQTFTVDAQMIGPLQNRAIVLHGMTVDGEYVATLPIACGQILPGNSGS